MDRALAALRRHKELVVFAIGMLLFAAGAAALMRSHQRTAARAFEGAGDAGAPASSVAGAGSHPAIGPRTGAMVGMYLEKRRAALKKAATAQPQAMSWAVVSFDSYREPETVTSLLSSQAGRSLTVAAFQQRVPVEGFAPETVEVGKGKVAAPADVLQDRAGAAVTHRLERERTDLAAVVRSVHDAAYRQVYEAEVDRLTAAVEALRSRPGTVFALVVRGTNDALYRLSRTPGVRLVDLPDPAATLPAGTRGAWGLLPDDTSRVTFGAPAS